MGEHRDASEKYGPGWKLRCEKVALRSGGWCKRGLQRGLRCRGADTHHLTYDRICHELLEDLQHVCNGCHEFLHHTPEGCKIRAAEREWRRARPDLEWRHLAAIRDIGSPWGRNGVDFIVIPTPLGHKAVKIEAAAPQCHDERRAEHKAEQRYKRWERRAEYMAKRRAEAEQRRTQPKPEDPEERWRREFFSMFGRE